MNLRLYCRAASGHLLVAQALACAAYGYAQIEEYTQECLCKVKVICLSKKLWHSHSWLCSLPTLPNCYDSEMRAPAAKSEFEKFLKKEGLSLTSLTPQTAFDAMLKFYKAVPVTDCVEDSSGDMLLAQWGTYDWGQGLHFELDFTRQLILGDAEDEDIFQLSLKVSFPPIEALREIANGNKWCQSLGEFHSFEAFVKSQHVYQMLASRADVLPRLSFSCPG